MSKETLIQMEHDYKNAFPINIEWLLEYAKEQNEVLQTFFKENIELDNFLNEYDESEHGRQNVIDVAMDIITKQDERVQELEQKIRVDSELFEKQVQQNKRYREAMINTIDELENIVHLNKSEDVLKHYAKNCIRFINEGLNID